MTSSATGQDSVGNMLGGEGVFCCCTFRPAGCLAHQGRKQEARRAFEKALAVGNDLGIFSEGYDTRTGEMLGNYPQGLTHLSLTAASLAIHQGKIRQ